MNGYIGKGSIHSLMESHRINRDIYCLPEVGEIKLIVGEEKNRGEWKKAELLHLLLGKDNILRGVILLHKGNRIEKPVQSICLLEIGSSNGELPESIMKKQLPW